MTTTIRKSADRGHFDHGWLKSYHSFSFAGYQDPRFMGFGPLRVINEDIVQKATGFGTHGHRDMEILTYMLDGELSHQDDTGGGSTIRPGQIQRMSAGRGIRHSEMNRSTTQDAHLLQIWIEPVVTGIDPGYQDHELPAAWREGEWALIATGDERVARAQSIAWVRQNVRVYAGRLNAQTLSQPLAAGRLGYLHVARGCLLANGEALGAGDALMLRDEPALQLTIDESVEVLFFDLPENG
ncbi:MAG: pirin family protein [Burkholderiaceae bacterium]